MKEFDINKIEQDDSKVETTELLTGSITQGLSPKTGVAPNAEVEEGEYVMYPDGTTQKVVGEEHTKGGVPMNLPDGTIILTDNLKPSASDRKRLEKEFDISIPKSATYSQIVDKYIQKTGLSKLYEEQEEAYEQLKDIVKKEDDTDNTTNKVNKEFISKKIYDIEQQKIPKEEQKRDFVKYLFTVQESNKKEENQPEEYKYGGLKKEKFEALCKKNGMSLDEGLEMLKHGGTKGYEDGGVKMYQDGGRPKNTAEARAMHEKGLITSSEYIDFVNEFGEASGQGSKRESDTYRIGYQDNVYKGEPRVSQSATQSGAFGNITDNEKAITNLYRNFPDLVSDIFKDDIKVENGQVKITSDIKLNEPNPKVKKLQKAMDKRMRASAKKTTSGDIPVGEEAVKAAEDYLQKQTFDIDGKLGSTDSFIREDDALLGNFTAGRFIPNVDVVQPKELDELQKEYGITTMRQLKNNPEAMKSLSDVSRDLVNEIDLGENADYALTPYEPQKIEAEEEIDPLVGVEDKAQVPERSYPKMFYTPDQRTLPPTNMLPHLRTKTRLGRIDPIRVGVEQNLQNISDTRQFTADQLRDLNPQQRAGALASLTASSQQAENQAITQANQVNAQNQAQAELFNIGQSDREQMQDARSALDFERRQYTARDKYDHNVRDWFLRNQKVALSDYDYNRRMNLTDSLFPDYTPNFWGNRIEFDPETEYSVENRPYLLQTMGQNQFGQ